MVREAWHEDIGRDAVGIRQTANWQLLNVSRSKWRSRATRRSHQRVARQRARRSRVRAALDDILYQAPRTTRPQPRRLYPGSGAGHRSSAGSRRACTAQASPSGSCDSTLAAFTALAGAAIFGALLMALVRAPCLRCTLPRALTPREGWPALVYCGPYVRAPNVALASASTRATTSPLLTPSWLQSCSCDRGDREPEDSRSETITPFCPARPRRSGSPVRIPELTGRTRMR